MNKAKKTHKAKSIINLFLSIYRCLLWYLSHKHAGFSEIYLMLVENQAFHRYFKEHNLRLPLFPHEKQAVHECFKVTENPSRFFTLFTPETILKAWKNAIAKFWTHKPKRKPGRPRLTKAIMLLILTLKLDNFIWGSRRIRDELANLVIKVSHESVCRVLHHYRKTGDIKPTLSWKKFISAHIGSLFACDFLTVTTFCLVTYYIFFIMKLETREIVQFGITEHPNRLFLRNQFTEFEYKYSGSYLIHDNSGELKWFPYSEYSIKAVSIAPYSPNMNAYAERFIRSIRQECLNFFIIFGFEQLYRIVTEYLNYYNNYRPHQSINRIPNGQPYPILSTGEIKKKSFFNGLHHHYYREAA